MSSALAVIALAAAAAFIFSGVYNVAATSQHTVSVYQYACATCHFIPGITGATKPVGPPLNGIANRSYIAGMLRNTNENVVAWVMSPQTIDPRSAMPDLGVSERDARAIAAYLATLSDR